MDRRVIAGVLAIGALAALWWLLPGLSAPATSSSSSGAGGAAADAHSALEQSAERRELSDAAQRALPDNSSASTEATATLRVHVLTETRAPLAGCKCSYGEVNQVTDTGGIARLVGPPGRRFLNVDPLAGEKREKESGFQTVEAGQIVDVTVTLRLRLEVAFCCRLVAAEDQQPIAGAKVCISSGRVSVTTDQAGACSAIVDSGRDWLDITARGRAPVRVVPEGGHETPGMAMLVPLDRGADLTLTVVDAASRPVTDYVVTLEAQPWRLQLPRVSRSRGQPFLFIAHHFESDGGLHINDLPAGVELHVRLDGLPESLAEPPRMPPLVLNPGANARQLVVEATGKIGGHLLDNNGRPMVGTRVTCLATGEEPGLQSLGMFVDILGHEFQNYFSTREDGGFELRVAAGAWLVGVDREPSDLVIPCLRVVVPPGGVATAELRAELPLTIHGFAIGPDGRPVPGLVINAERDGRLAATGRTSTDGSFQVTKLRAGRHQLTTDPYEDSLGLAAPVNVDAGEQDLTLHLVAAFGTVRGRVVDADSGTPAVAWVMASQRDGDNAIGNRCDLDGGFVYRGLRPGIWDLVASDTRGRCAIIAGLQIVAGGELDQLQLALQPGAVLRPRHPDADEFVVVRGGDVIARDNLPDGAPGEARVLPGAWTVRFLRKDREIARRDVTVRAGDDVLVDGR